MTICFQETGVANLERFFLIVADWPQNLSKKMVRNSTTVKTHTPKQRKFNTYIFRVLKQVHPDTIISAPALEVMNDYVNDIFNRVMDEAVILMEINKRGTLTSREIQTAVRLILPGELAKHAVSEGTKAVTKFHSYCSGGPRVCPSFSFFLKFLFDQRNIREVPNRQELDFNFLWVESTL